MSHLTTSFDLLKSVFNIHKLKKSVFTYIVSLLSYTSLLILKKCGMVFESYWPIGYLCKLLKCEIVLHFLDVKLLKTLIFRLNWTESKVLDESAAQKFSPIIFICMYHVFTKLLSLKRCERFFSVLDY